MDNTDPKQTDPRRVAYHSIGSDKILKIEKTGDYVTDVKVITIPNNSDHKQLILNREMLDKLKMAMVGKGLCVNNGQVWEEPRTD